MPLSHKQRREFEKFPPKVQQHYNDEVAGLQAVLNHIIATNQTAARRHKDPAEIKSYQALFAELEMLLFESTVLYSLKNTNPSRFGGSFIPIVAQGVGEHLSHYLLQNETQNDEQSQELTSVACGAVAMVIASRLNLGQSLFKSQHINFTSISITLLQKQVLTLQLSPVNQSKLILILYRLQLATEAEELLKLVGTSEHHMEETQKYTISAIFHLISTAGKSVPLLTRLMLTASMRLIDSWLRYNKYHPNLLAILDFCGDKESRFDKALLKLAEIYLHKHTEHNVWLVLSKLGDNVLRKIFNRLSSNSLHTLLHKVIADNEIVRTRFNKIYHPKIEHTLPPKVKQPPTALESIIIFDTTPAHPLQPQTSPLCIPPAFSSKCSALIQEYKNIATQTLPVQAQGWQHWVLCQRSSLGICQNLLEKIMLGEHYNATALNSLTDLLQKYLLLRAPDETQLTKQDWFLKKPQFQALKLIAQQHFALQLSIAQHFQSQGQADYTDWFSGFYPYLPTFSEEGLFIRQFATQLLREDISLREVGSRIYWPKLAEDIDLYLSSNTQNFDYLSEKLNLLTKFGWYRTWTKDQGDYVIFIYHHANFKGLDIIIYKDPTYQSLRFDPSKRGVNIASAEANLLFSSVHFIPEHAASIYRGETDCFAGAMTDDKYWPIVTKSLWKMYRGNQQARLAAKSKNDNQIPQYKLGKNLSLYETDLHKIDGRITLFHLLELINKSLAIERIEGLWDLFLTITQEIGTLTLFVAAPYNGNKKAAWEKAQALLLIENNCLKGWFLLILYSVNSPDDFFSHAKLGLHAEQQTMLLRFKQFCNALARNPFSPSPDHSDLPIYSRRLEQFCRAYWTNGYFDHSLAN
jgi:hypothetical protein